MEENRENLFANKQKSHQQQPFAPLKCWCEGPVFQLDGHVAGNGRVNISRTAKCNMATCLHPTRAWRCFFFFGVPGVNASIL